MTTTTTYLETVAPTAYNHSLHPDDSSKPPCTTIVRLLKSGWVSYLPRHVRSNQLPYYHSNLMQVARPCPTKVCAKERLQGLRECEESTYLVYRNRLNPEASSPKNLYKTCNTPLYHTFRHASQAGMQLHLLRCTVYRTQNVNNIQRDAASLTRHYPLHSDAISCKVSLNCFSTSTFPPFWRPMDRSCEYVSARCLIFSLSFNTTSLMRFQNPLTC